MNGFKKKMVYYEAQNKRLGIPLKLNKTIKSFLKERTFQARIGSNLSKKKTISAGIPKGAIFSPTILH